MWVNRLSPSSKMTPRAFALVSMPQQTEISVMATASSFPTLCYRSPSRPQRRLNNCTARQQQHNNTTTFAPSLVRHLRANTRSSVTHHNESHNNTVNTLYTNQVNKRQHRRKCVTSLVLRPCSVYLFLQAHVMDSTIMLQLIFVFIIALLQSRSSLLRRLSIIP